MYIFCMTSAKLAEKAHPERPDCGEHEYVRTSREFEGIEGERSGFQHQKKHELSENSSSAAPTLNNAKLTPASSSPPSN